MLKFFYNGIKENKDKLQKAHYSMGGYIGMPEGTITIYKRDYGRFTEEVSSSFIVQNDTDSMTDYFCKDRIRVLPDHKLYKEVSNAYLKQQDRYSKKYNTGGVK